MRVRLTLEWQGLLPPAARETTGSKFGDALLTAQADARYSTVCVDVPIVSSLMGVYEQRESGCVQRQAGGRRDEERQHEVGGVKGSAASRVGGYNPTCGARQAKACAPTSHVSRRSPQLAFCWL